MSAPPARKSALHTMSQARRRALVLTMQLGMAVYALTFAFLAAASWWLVVLILCLQALYMVIFFRVIRPVASEVSDRKTADLDERQVKVRDRAHHQSYQILVIIIVIVTAAPMAASFYLGVDLPLQLAYWHFAGLFFFFMNLGISLPASVVAWTEPDPEPEIEEEDRHQLER